MLLVIATTARASDVPDMTVVKIVASNVGDHSFTLNYTLDNIGDGQVSLSNIFCEVYLSKDINLTSADVMVSKIDFSTTAPKVGVNLPAYNGSKKITTTELVSDYTYMIMVIKTVFGIYLPDNNHDNNILAANIYCSISTRFSWPLRQKSGVNDPGYWYIAEYVDDNRDAGDANILDYNGGTHTYDGHAGTDIATYPYSWKKVQDNAVEVIAGADGIIVEIDDGNEDQHCSWDEKGAPNYVKLKHADGCFSIYKHMKKNSVTKKKVGDKIVRGEYLGVVASSGHASGPHLHFAITDAYDNVVDPWKGPKNPICESLWASQLAYLPSGLNYIAITTDITQAVSPACPTIENTYENYDLIQGDDFYLNVMVRHEKKGDNYQYRIYRPDNTLWQIWNTTASADHSHRNNYKHLTVGVNDPTGTYRVEVDYGGKTFKKSFKVSGIPLLRTFNVVPNPAGNEMTVELNNIQEPVSISVFNSMGEKLCSFPERLYTNDLSFPIDKLPSGFLIVRITGNNFSETVKVYKE